MGVVFHDQKGPLGINTRLVLSGLDITVPAGEYAGEVLEADSEYSVTVDGTHDTTVCGYLVRNAGTLAVAFDEVVDDGVDLPFDFDDDLDLSLIYALFWVVVPPGTTDLNTLDVQVYRMVKT